MDIVTPAVRSRMMAGIRHADTTPEKIIRSGLHRAGFRFVLHDTSLPGKPDLVLPRYRAVIFVHGCFWHRHDCELFHLPATRRAFWQAKLDKNRERDQRHLQQLTALGWRVGVVWECEIRGSQKDPAKVCQTLADWLLEEMA